MGITMEELLQMLGAKDVELYLLRKQIAALTPKKEPEAAQNDPHN